MNNRGIWPVGGFLLIAIVGAFFIYAGKALSHKNQAQEEKIVWVTVGK